MGINTILKIAIKTSPNINLACVRFYHKILLKSAQFRAIIIVLLEVCPIRYVNTVT